jgi:hypothetical protein
MNKLGLTIGNAFKAVGQGWKNMPLQNKLYMGTVITDKLAGKSNFGGLGLAIANASMDLSGQPRGFGSRGGNKSKSNGNSLSIRGQQKKGIEDNLKDPAAVSSAPELLKMKNEHN